jgi:acyl-homoserine-lactone acylase
MKRRGLVVFALLLAALAAGARLAHLRARGPVPGATDEQRAQAARVHILRDSWGVPHIYGKSDADAAFGLAFAHAEDDWPTIQKVLAAARGRLSLLQLSKAAVLTDYFAALIRVGDLTEQQYPKLAPDTRALLEAYARGLTFYAALHPGEADARLLPVTGKDIAAGFVEKMPFLLNVPDVLAALNAGHAPGKSAQSGGSNGHALAAFRSTDGKTRLNINSHQPWEGPVAWYEAQVVSEEGWNMTGGLFPGSPVILHGHNDKLGWAHTVNAPAEVDVYPLTVRDDREYLLDNQWLPLDAREAAIQIDLELFTLTIHRQVLQSAHGPVLQTKAGFFAIRYAGRERSAQTVEQWYRMDKARSLAEWKAAMELQAIPMFNAVYADGESNILYVYNALLPIRGGLKGDVSKDIWTRYLPFKDLPQVLNPPSGFVYNCNTTPFAATAGEGNPRAADFDPRDGIELTQNNRGLRSLALLGGERKLSQQDFEAMKFDRTYARESHLFKDVVDPLLQGPPRAGKEQQGLELLRAWNGVAAEDSTAAALAILTAEPLDPAAPAADPFSAAVHWLLDGYGRQDDPLGEVQRLRRGKLDLPLGGGPDVLNAAMTRVDGKHLVGRQGDSLIILVDFDAAGATSRSIIQYGASNREGAPHYADQAPLFVAHQLKPTLRRLEDLRAHLERDAIPGR